MEAAPLTPNEQERLAALSKYKLVELTNTKILNQITELASLICEVPICLITVIDKQSNWYLSNHGLKDATEAPRDLSFCAHAILTDQLMEITDATLDERFHDNPSVLSSPKIRFYAGMPLVDPNGYKLGTICLIDKKTRELTTKQEIILDLFSKMVMTIIEANANLFHNLDSVQKQNQSAQDRQ